MAQQKVRDYAKLAKDIIQAVGGEENIMNATRCATRLRLTLKETPAGAADRVSALPAVITVVEKGGQFQVVIGTHVGEVYEIVAKELHLEEKQGEAVENKGSILNRVIASMSGCIAPFVYILAACGLLQGALIIATGFVPSFADTSTYAVLSFMSWTPFTFLPVMIAVAGSKHFKCNTFIAVLCCCALVNPDWTSLAGRIADGENLKFIIFNLAETTYTSTVLPPIILVCVLAYVERFFEKHLPALIKPVFVPLCCFLIMVPATLVIIGPITAMIAHGLSNAYTWFYDVIPPLCAFVTGVFWQCLVIFGVHWSFTPVNLADYEQYGRCAMQGFMAIAVCAQMGASLGVWFKSKNKDLKTTAFSAGLTGLFGITEPAIYGVTLRLKKPFICGCLCAGVGSLISTFFNTYYYVYAGLAGILTMPNAYNPENPTSIYGSAIGTVVAIIGAFVLVQIVGFDDPVEPVAAEGPSSDIKVETVMPKTVAAGNADMFCPLNGEIKALKEVNDPTFAEEILGKGVAVLPSEGKLYAPCDGEVISLFESKHAIGIMSNDGVELLIHIGLETVSLGGKYFDAKVKVNDTVKKGDLLITFDLDAIKKEGYDPITPVIVTNPDDFAEVVPDTLSGKAVIGTHLFTVRR